MKGKPWPAKAVAVLKRRYPHEPTKAIAADLGMTINAVYQKAQTLGLKKTEEYLNGPHASRLRPGHQRGMGTRFQPGQAPLNKGVKGWQAGGRATETQFKKGQMPHNTKPIGSYRFDASGTLQRKISNDKGSNSKRWRGVHELVWIETNGPVPPKHIVVFKQGMRTIEPEEITLDRVECISLAENMARNTYHNYPKPIAELIQLRGALVRKINAAERHYQETATP